MAFLMLAIPIIIILLFWYATRNNDYWTKQGIFQLKPVPFFGHFWDRFLMKVSFHEFDMDIYRKLAGHKFGGYYEGPKPILMIRDPELIRAVLVKDFDHFVDRRIFVVRDEKSVLGNMITQLEGQEWKDVRSVMTPTFTSGKMKKMMSLVNECGDQLVNYLDQYAESREPLEMKTCFGKYTMDVIASTAFGVQCNSLKNPDSEFVKMATRLQNPGKLRMFLFFLIFTTSTSILKIIQALGISLLDKKVTDFFSEVTTTTIAHREKHGVRRPDFLQLMIDARRGDLAKDEENIDTFEKEAVIKNSPLSTKSVVTDTVIIAQSLIFFLAGFDTTGTLLTFASYELALQPDLQERLREEILTVLKKHDGLCTYEAIQEMTYLDMCLMETLRKNPPASRLDRRCTVEYKIPNTEITLEKESLLTVSIAGLHHDSQYYPEPDKFDPERFSSENKAKRSPYVFVPFGHGPRNCIGMRFAVMEAKVAMVSVLRHFQITVCEKTQVPCKYNKVSSLLAPEGGMWLTVKKVSE